MAERQNLYFIAIVPPVAFVGDNTISVRNIIADITVSKI
jgi:hypothetical protein